MIMGGKKEMEQKKDDSGSKEGGSLKDKLTKLGKTLKRILPMKETVAAVSIGVMSQALPSCTTTFKPGDAEVDNESDTPADVTPDTPSEADVPADMESDEDIVEDTDGDSPVCPGPTLPEVTETDVGLFLGDSVTVNGIDIKLEHIESTSLEALYTFSCLGVPLEGEMIIPGAGRNRNMTFPEENVYVYILQKEITAGRVLIDITVRQDT